MNRVKFYSKEDLACGMNLKKIEDVLKVFDENKKYEINDILEFHNCIKYIDNECFLATWEREQLEQIKEKIKKLKKINACFFKEIDEKNIINTIEQIDFFYYIDDFWELFDKYKIYNRISDEIFEEILKNNKLLEIITNYKDIVKYYGEVIKAYLLTYEESAIIILNKYEIKQENNNKTIYFPEELTNEDKETILVNYINSLNPNINYLRIIFNMQSTKDMPVSDKTRLMAKRKIQKETDKLFKENSGIKMETLVSFSKKMENVVKEELKGTNIECMYSSDWIEDNIDFPTLLNNFIYLFNFVDSCMRSNFISKRSQLGIFERYIFLETKKSYKIGTAFERIDILSTLQMMAYYNELKRLNIRFEEVLDWFFKEYLLNEFEVSDYRINIPSEKSSYLEKCRTILSELDNILKQYRLFVEDNKIDHELLQISSRPIPFYDVPSKVKNKYIYSNSEEYNSVSALLFSDQCMLSYLEKLEKKYDNFFDLIVNENVKFEDYPEYEHQYLNFLISKQYLEINKDGFLKFKNIERVIIFKDLNYNEVVCYWKYSKKYRTEIDKMLNEGILNEESSLFSKAEIDYLNYYLNKSEFNNGLDLRNMYIHGTQPNENEFDKIHETNYMRILKIFVLVIIKINDDLITYDECKNNK